MPEPNERDKQLAQSATDGEGLGPEVLDRIERAVARGREEGRLEGIKEALEEEPLTPALDALALLAKQAERIAELEAKLARWRPIARAAALWRQAIDLLLGEDVPSNEVLQRRRDASSALIAAVETLSEQERSELLEEEEG